MLAVSAVAMTNAHCAKSHKLVCAHWPDLQGWPWSAPTVKACASPKLANVHMVAQTLAKPTAGKNAIEIIAAHLRIERVMSSRQHKSDR